MVNSENTVYDKKDWRRVNDSIQLMPSPKKWGNIRQESIGDDGQETLDAWQVQETIISSATESKLVWQWYVVAGRISIDPIYTKLVEAKAKLVGDKRGSYVIVVATDLGLNEEVSRAMLSRFVIDAASDLNRLTNTLH